MSQLCFDNVMGVSQFSSLLMKDGGENSTESVNRLLSLIPHPVQRKQHRALTHGAVVVIDTWHDVLTIAGD